jgi:hypothetical protein
MSCHSRIGFPKLVRGSQIFGAMDTLICNGYTNLQLNILVFSRYHIPAYHDARRQFVATSTTTSPWAIHRVHGSGAGTLPTILHSCHPVGGFVERTGQACKERPPVGYTGLFGMSSCADPTGARELSARSRFRRLLVYASLRT